MICKSTAGPPAPDGRATRPGDSERGPPSAVRVFASRPIIRLNQSYDGIYMQRCPQSAAQRPQVPAWLRFRR
jgi:hypothetical protein